MQSVDLSVGSDDEGTLEVGSTQAKRLRSQTGLAPWTAGAPLPGPRAHEGVAVTEGHLYVVGGCATWNGGSCSDTRAEVFVAALQADGTMGPWTSAPPLPSARQDAAVVAHAGFLYAVGGQNGAGQALAEVLVSRVHPDGTLEPWTATTALANGRSAAALMSSGGALIVAGGQDAGGGFLADVQVADAHADGSLGAWTPTTPLPSGRAFATGRAVSATLYLAGGFGASGALAEVVSSAQAPSGALGPWSPCVPLPAAVGAHALVSANSFLYALGGTTSPTLLTGLSGVLGAPRYANGDVGAWRPQANALPQSVSFAGASSWQDNLYVVGGMDGTSQQPSARVWRSRADGSLALPVGVGAWKATTPLLGPRQQPGAAAANGFLYVVGGCIQGTLAGNCSLFAADTMVSRIQADGSLGPWAEAAEVLPSPRTRVVALATTSHLYSIAGQKFDGTAMSDVTVAPFLADGGIGPWLNSPFALKGPRRSAAGVLVGSSLFILGGQLSTYYNDGEQSSLDASGMPGPFLITPSFSDGRMEHQVVASDGFLYLLGGWDGTTHLGDVQSAAILGDGGLGAFAPAGTLAETSAVGAGMTVAGQLFAGAGDSNTGPYGYFQEGFLSGGQATFVGPSPSLLPGSVSRAASVASNGFLYLIAGNEGSAISTRVLMAQLRAVGQNATHTVAVDLGAGVASLDQLNVQAALPPKAVLHARYRSAPDSGVYGPWTELGAVTPGTAVPLGVAHPRYVALELTLQDDAAGTYDTLPPSESVLSALLLGLTLEPGPPAPGDYAVGCSCQSGGPAGPFTALSLVLMALMRGRPGRAPRPTSAAPLAGPLQAASRARRSRG